MATKTTKNGNGNGGKKPKEETTAMVPVHSQVLDDDELRALLGDQMEGLDIVFPVAKILHAGAEMFDLGEGHGKVESFAGIIIDRHPANAYWQNPATAGQSIPPDCSSLDGQNGVGAPGGSCYSCPFNQFGSGKDGHGKACKNTQRLYVLLDAQDNVPFLLMVPPSSLKVVSAYLTRLLGANIPMMAVATEFTLKGKQNAHGDYSELVVARGTPLDLEAFKRVLNLRKELMNFMRQRKIDQTDLGGDREDVTGAPTTEDEAGENIPF